MRKTGRDASYREALASNLIKSLLVHKKIQTTRARGKIVLNSMVGRRSIQVVMKHTTRRRGDNAPQVTIEITEKKKKLS